MVAAAVSFTVRSRAAAIEDAWRDKRELVYGDPVDPSWNVAEAKESLRRLGSLVDEAKDETFVLTSLVEQGMQALRFAQEVEEPPDRELNEIARSAFNKLLERFPENPLAVGTAHSALATVEENAFVLDSDAVHEERARAHLRAIIDDEALSLMPFGRMALDRTKALEATFTPVTFAKAPPPPAPRQAAQSPEAPAAATPQPIKIEPMPGPPPGFENLVPITPGAPELPLTGEKKATPEQPEGEAESESADEPGNEQLDTGASHAPKSEPEPESGGGRPESGEAP